MPTAVASIDTMFIAMVAGRDLDANAAWVAEPLGATIAPTRTIPYRTINRAFALPDGTMHELTTATRRRDLPRADRYPDAATARPAAAGLLPAGVAVVSLLHPSLDTVSAPWVSLLVRRAGAIHQGRRSGVLRLPEGALLELIEAAP